MTKLTNLATEAKQIVLSREEKALLRARIFGEPSPAFVPSPYVMFSFSLRSVVALSLVLVVLVGSGTAVAAQAALPGELLYTVKVNVNERVAGALAVSTEAKA